MFVLAGTAITVSAYNTFIIFSAFSIEGTHINPCFLAIKHNMLWLMLAFRDEIIGSLPVFLLGTGILVDSILTVFDALRVLFPQLQAV